LNKVAVDEVDSLMCHLISILNSEDALPELLSIIRGHCGNHSKAEWVLLMSFDDSCCRDRHAAINRFLCFGFDSPPVGNSIVDA
jgi:hypothetical protein